MKNIVDDKNQRQSQENFSIIFLEDFQGSLSTILESVEKELSDNAAEIERRDLTYQVIGSDDDAAKEQNGRRDSVMHSEDHVVDNGLVDQISHLDKPGDRRDQTKHRHFRLICKKKEALHFYRHRQNCQ